MKNYILTGFADEIDPMMQKQYALLHKLGIEYIELRGVNGKNISELTEDKEFWRGCQGCCNYDILQRNNRRMCLCTGMLYDPAKEPPQVQSRMAPYIMFFKNKFKKLFHLK